VSKFFQTWYLKTSRRASSGRTFIDDIWRDIETGGTKLSMALNLPHRSSYAAKRSAFLIREIKGFILKVFPHPYYLFVHWSIFGYNCPHSPCLLLTIVYIQFVVALSTQANSMAPFHCLIEIGSMSNSHHPQWGIPILRRDTIQGQIFVDSNQ
jgi:hypothetical protein